ncbi:protein disulfide-isomerase A4 [Faustovirus]|nr:protein disulfide-isomerase A4 [Faustovirus]QJX73387.1 protein disulfide-isomerase A4 [Faustovirus]
MHRLCAALIVILLILMVVAHFADKSCGCGCLAGAFGCKCATCTQTAPKESFGGRTEVRYMGVSWCPYCKQMNPIWEAVKLRMKQEDPSIIFTYNDEDKSPTMDVKSYPTILVMRDRRAYTYSGGPDMEKLYNFILNPID